MKPIQGIAALLLVGAGLVLLMKHTDPMSPALARLSPLPPTPLDPTNRWADDARAVRLGHWLFFDPSLSSDRSVSCATCHDPSLAFTDGKPLAETLGVGTRKTQTILNTAHSRWFFWDGRADSLWAQATEPIENPLEMGMDRVALAHRMYAERDLKEAYETLFGPLPQLRSGDRFPAHARPVPEDPEHAHAVAWDEMSEQDRESINRFYSNLGKALAAYERQLVRANAPFDLYVAALSAGDPDGGGHLSDSAVRGLDLFLGRGNCTTCHNGPTFSDLEFHNNQVPTADGRPPSDPGRFEGARLVKANPFNAAGRFSDEDQGAAAARVRRLKTGSVGWGEFKTPSLRNLEGRAPYFHAGQMPDLEAVLHFYSTLEGASGQSHHQENVLKPIDLSPRESADLIALLESLEGQALDPRWGAAPPGPGLKEHP
ncbi:MAG: cytochrome c peroxidase [Planctomycetota bacterium]|nr:cytochrome c peroxidase [Planctomycetota bacterium]